MTKFLSQIEGAPPIAIFPLPQEAQSEEDAEDIERRKEETDSLAGEAGEEQLVTQLGEAADNNEGVGAAEIDGLEDVDGGNVVVVADDDGGCDDEDERNDEQNDQRRLDNEEEEAVNYDEGKNNKDDEGELDGDEHGDENGYEGEEKDGGENENDRGNNNGDEGEDKDGGENEDEGVRTLNERIELGDGSVEADSLPPIPKHPNAIATGATLPPPSVPPMMPHNAGNAVAYSQILAADHQWKMQQQQGFRQMQILEQRKHENMAARAAANLKSGRNKYENDSGKRITSKQKRQQAPFKQCQPQWPAQMRPSFQFGLPWPQPNGFPGMGLQQQQQQQPKLSYYAVRRGRKGSCVRNAIFLNWKDCRRVVEGNDKTKRDGGSTAAPAAADKGNGGATAAPAAALKCEFDATAAPAAVDKFDGDATAAPAAAEKCDGDATAAPEAVEKGDGDAIATPADADKGDGDAIALPATAKKGDGEATAAPAAVDKGGGAGGAEYRVFYSWQEAERYLRPLAATSARAQGNKKRKPSPNDRRSCKNGRYAPTPRWFRMLGELMAYMDAHGGSCNVVVDGRRDEEDGHGIMEGGDGIKSKGEVEGEDEFKGKEDVLLTLRAWVVSQRKQYREYLRKPKSSHHSMTEEKVERLTEISFDFGPLEGAMGGRRRSSDNGAAGTKSPAKRKLRNRKAEGKDVDVNGDDGDETRSRKKHRGQQPRKPWTDMLEHLKEYKEANGGSMDIPKQVKGQDNEYPNKEIDKLRVWCLDQKASYIRWKKGVGDKGGMSQAKADMLIELGFDLRSWDNKYEQLLEYKARHETTEMPQDDDGPLATWVRKQRELFSRHLRGKNTKLTKDQVDHLIAVGMQPTRRGRPSGGGGTNLGEKSESDEVHWSAMVDQLRWYKIEHDDANVPIASGTELAKWVTVQRREYDKLQSEKSSTLTALRLQRLGELGFQFKPRGRYVSWDDRVNDLRKYKDAFGDLKVPTSHPTLGSFIKKCRRGHKEYMEGKPSCLTKERWEELSDLGFVFQMIKTPKRPDIIRSWEERFQELIVFKEEYGHTIVPQLSGGLGEWVHAQRGMYKKLKAGKKSQMSLEKALKLAEIGFCFDASRRFKGTRKPEPLDLGFDGV